MFVGILKTAWSRAWLWRGVWKLAPSRDFRNQRARGQKTIGSHLKVDGTSFSDAGSLVTTAHLTREICPLDLKYRKSKTNMGAQKLLLTRCFSSCLSEIGSKQKLSFGRQLLSNSVCVRKTLLVTQCPKFKAKVSISVAINPVGHRDRNKFL